MALREDVPAGQTGLTSQLSEPNPLDVFASYTYNITLAALSPDEYNELVKNPKTEFVPENVLITTAAGNKYKRNEFFEREFYIQSLKFDTIVGLNAQTRASNVISLKMEVVEPLGLSFFDRLLNVTRQFGYDNIVDTPYLIIIEFTGYDDQGNIVKGSMDGHKKFIPIRIINSNMKVTSGGTSYVIDAIPYNHVAFLASETGASVPVKLQIPCQTVNQFFTGYRNQSVQSAALSTALRQRQNTIDQYERGLREGEAGLLTTQRVRDYPIFREFTRALNEAPVLAGSFADGLNQYEKYIEEQGLIKKANTYNFIVDEEIAKSEFRNRPGPRSTNRVPFSEPSDPLARSLISNLPVRDTGNRELYTVNAGDSVIEVINTVIKNSQYAHAQLNVNNSENKNKIINFFKIVPKVEIKVSDGERNLYSKNITYIIDQYKFNNTKSPALSKTLPTKFLTEYNYIFTGKNQSIIDLRIEYDALFPILLTSGNEKNQITTSDNVIRPPLPENRDVYPNFRFQGDITPAQRYIKSNFVQQRGAATEDSPETQLMADAFSNILNISPDMMAVNLKIVGDPRYIKQDDVFFTSANSDIKDQLLSSNNSILFDYEERYLKLNFKTPLDYSMDAGKETGLLDRTDRYLQSKFSGLYRILRIENNFYRGKFEQTLDIIRLFNQDEYGRELPKTNKQNAPDNSQRGTS